jgi:WD40 repeat protein
MPADPAQAHIEKSLTYTSPLISCRIDPKGRFAFAGAQDSSVARFQLSDGKITPFKAHQSWVRAIAFSADGETLITGGHDGQILWWSTTAEEPTPLRQVQGHQGWIRALAVSPDGQKLASCGNDLKVKVWNLADGALLQELSGHERHVYNVAFHPTEPRLISGDLVAKFFDWDLTTGQARKSFPIASLSKFDPGFLADYGGPFSLHVKPDGKQVLAGGITNVSNAFAGVGNPIVSVIDWEAGTEALTHQSKAAIQGTTWGVAWHPDGFVVGAVGGQGGGHLFFWKPDQKDEFQTLNLANVCRDLALHPDGLRIATAHYDSILRITLLAPKAG